MKTHLDPGNMEKLRLREIEPERYEDEVCEGLLEEAILVSSIFFSLFTSCLLRNGHFHCFCFRSLSPFGRFEKPQVSAGILTNPPIDSSRLESFQPIASSKAMVEGTM